MSLDQEIQAYREAFQEKRLPKPPRCEVCGGPGPLHWHAVYERSLICFHETVVLPVHRVLCSACHATFVSLPDFVVKFYRYARPVIRFALDHLKRCSFNAVADLLMDHCGRAVATFTLYLWRRRFARAPT
jgi:hypothetical protein